MSEKDFPTKVNRHVIQSYIFSNARSRFNIVQMRILCRLVEFAQCELEGLLIRDNMTKIAHNLRHIDMELPTASVLPAGSKHYEQVRRACLEMMSKKCELYDSESKKWKASPLIYNVELDARDGVLRFSVADFVWDAMLDFTHGFRKYELSTVLSLHSAHSMKMYTLLSGQKYPIEYTIDNLREMFGVGDKYAQPTDFIKKIIKPCQEELNKTCPTSFDFKAVKTGRKITSILFMPFEQKEKKDAALETKRLQSQVSFSLFYSHVYNYLRYHMEMQPREIKSNQKLFEDATKELPDILGLLVDLQGRRRTENGGYKGVGWVINAVRAELNIARDRQSRQS